MKDIDEELNARIKAAFEDLDDGEGDEGWALLRTKYPVTKRRKLPIWWISSAAAVLLIICGIAFFFDRSPETGAITQNDAAKTIVKDPKDLAKVQNEQIENQSATNEPQQGIAPLTQAQETRIAQHGPQKNQAIARDPSKTLGKDSFVSILITPNKTDLTSAIASTTDQKDSANHLATAAIEIPKTEIATAQPTSVTKLSTEDFLTLESKLKTKAENKAKNSAVKSKSSLEVFTGTFLNYADNDVKVNAGFGLNANLKVTKNLFLTVGAGISQNKIDYQNANDLPMSTSNAVQASPNSSNSLSSAPVITDVKLAAQLLNFDMPIAVKFYPTKKQNFYVSTGINSSSYLTQQYTYTYSTISASSFFERKAQPEEQTEQVKNGGFDFATSAIFAIGVNQNIGQHQLIFEPYFKPAIGNMGDKNLRINTVGLNLKFNFNNQEKK
jgi:hypothetical protein